MLPYRYLDTLVVAFVAVLLVSNLVAQKICRIGPFKISGAELLFPIAYIFADIFTEVYGYAASRRAIWMGFFAMALVSIVGGIIVLLPPDPGWPDQRAFTVIFRFVPRIFVASLVAYCTGEFANSYTMAKLKLLTEGRWLWTRTLGSTVVGQAVDTVLVMVLAFWGRTSWSTMGQLILWAYLGKVLYETAATPLTYKVVASLKRAEHSDAFDREEDFNPFIFSAPGRRARFHRAEGPGFRNNTASRLQSGLAIHFLSRPSSRIVGGTDTGHPGNRRPPNFRIARYPPGTVHEASSTVCRLYIQMTCTPHEIPFLLPRKGALFRRKRPFWHALRT